MQKIRIMNLNNFSIKKLLFLIAFLIALVLIVIGFTTNHYIKKSFSQFDLLMKIDEVLRVELQLRKAEKDFLLRETINPDFFKSGKGPSTVQFDSISRRAIELMNNLKANELVEGNAYGAEINSAIVLLNKYNAIFVKINDLTLEKGFKDYGIEGQLRQAIHNVEKLLNESNDYRFSTYMLTLRRHEKDYLLRKEIKYKESFWDVLEGFSAEIRKQGNSNRNNQIIASLRDYGKLFNLLIEKGQQIGLNENEALLKDLKITSEQFESQLKALHAEIYNQSKSAIQVAILTLFGLIIVLSVFAVSTIIWVTGHIVKSIRKLRGFVIRLGNGELPDEMQIDGQNEITQMAESINVLTANLKNTREFAVEVGNGNLEKEVNVFGNEGDLGGALIEMRKKLLQVSREREQQAQETQQRLWANEGMALFAQVLGRREMSIEDLAFEIIKNLVKYTKSNQAGLFLINESHELVLTAAYAYERRKFLKKILATNEGLVGMCYLEAETTYLTDIPADYLYITSGMGQATPKCLILVPLKSEDEVIGVIEMASLYEYSPFEIKFIENVVNSVASTLSMVRVRVSTNELLEKTKLQAEILSEHEEELRQNIEEMHATQESMTLRERELLDEIEAQKGNILSIKNEYHIEIERIKAKQHEFELLKGVIDGSFIVIEIATDGSIIRANQNFYNTIKLNSADELPTIFDGSLPGQEKQNRKEWSRILQGESYKGIIYRIDLGGSHIAIQAVFSPQTDESEQEVRKIICVGQKIGLASNVESNFTMGNWYKDFIGSAGMARKAEIN